MKFLAELAMKQPVNAFVISAISAALPLTFWLAAAIVGLVTLRKGQTEGIKALSGAILGIVIGAVSTGSLTAYVTVILMCPVVVILALVLRNTQSWAWTLMSASGCGIVLAITAAFALEEPFKAINQELVNFVQQSGQNGLYEQLIMTLTEKNALPMLMAGGSVDMAILSLILARYWQSALFNPGGFRVEFHALRLQPWMVLTLIAMAGLISLWSLFALEPTIMPLLISGTALIHGIVAKKELGGVWLTVFYIALLLFTLYALPFILLLAIADAWFDFRTRIRPSSN
ncbi:hypothetical protein [Gynuella sp.]|uniref:hypothetical protein n=1 Tax=Gynuella sp. TaxID=2969146 RepID=UPI003D0C37B3